MKLFTSLVAVTAAALCQGTFAQESVNKDLDACIHTEQVQMTAKGAAIGALAGLLKSSLSNKKNDTLKNVAAGAVVGGAAGFVTAYYKATGNCYKHNPTWVPEAKLQRSAGYEQAKAAVGYRPEMGAFAKVTSLEVAPASKAGSPVPLTSRYVALTPDGSEADVVIERKLFAKIDGAEQEVPFPGRGREQRKVEAGETTDVMMLPVPAEVAAGTTFRYEISVSPAGSGQPFPVSASTTVN